MYEKVNPGHPDKIADRIAGAIVDLAYTKNQDPKAAVEVPIGHGKCHIINECSEHLELKDIEAIVKRISKKRKHRDRLCGISARHSPVRQSESSVPLRRQRHLQRSACERRTKRTIDDRSYNLQ